MRILGVDPGLKATGYGVIEADVREPRKVHLLECGTIEPKQKNILPDKLSKIQRHLQDIISEHHPELMVLEKLYSHSKYPTTSYILGHARGVICLLCAQNRLRLVEHSVKRIRKSLVGNGNATKQQTREVVARVLGVEAAQLTLDASDALALAMGYLFMQRTGVPRLFGEGEKK